MKKKILVIVSTVIGVLLVAGGIVAYLYLKPPTQEEIDTYNGLVAEGDLLLEAHEYSEAVNKYNSAIKVIRIETTAYSRIVDIYLLKNDFETAMEVAQQAQNSASSAEGISLIYADIAEAYWDDEDYYNAKINYEVASALDANPIVNLRLAKSYVYDSEFDSARNLLSGDYDFETVDEAKLLYAYILGAEDIDEAQEFLSEYTVTDAEMSSYFEEYSSILDSLTDDELFNITKLSRIYINNGYSALAIKLLEPKIEDIDQYIDALYFLGKAYLDVGQYDQSIEILLKAASLLGYESDKYWMLARAYYFKNDLVSAMTYYDMSVEYVGDDITRDLVEEYLNVLLDSNQTIKAQDVYADVVDSIESEWLYLIGLELYYNQSDVKFDYYLNKLADMDMNDSWTKEYLFWKIRKDLDDSKLDDVEEDLENLLELDRFNSQYYWMKGVYEISLSEDEAAKDSFELALEYDLGGITTEEVEKLLAELE